MVFLFQRIGHGWVREVHMHTSKRKRGKSFVLFRNRHNRVFLGVDALVSHLKGEGEDVSFLDWHNFLSERAPEVAMELIRKLSWCSQFRLKLTDPTCLYSVLKVVSNRVGASRQARKAAEEWSLEVTSDYPMQCNADANYSNY